MRIFTRMGLHQHDDDQRRDWIRWAMGQAGYPVPPGNTGIEQHVIHALQRAKDDPLPQMFWRDSETVERLGGLTLVVGGGEHDPD
jgi:hypothetical protein